MGLFRPYERKENASGDRISTLTPKGQKAEQKARQADLPTEQVAQVETLEKIKVSRKKEGATTSRKEAEAARIERLHPSLTKKEQKKADRKARNDAWAERTEKQESSPERKLLRNYVDTRWTAAEFMMPAMILIMAGVMLTMNNAQLSMYVALLLWVALGITLINVGFMWRGYKKLLDQRVPGASKRGLLIYMFNRSLMLRRFRQPGPVIKRGDPI